MNSKSKYFKLFAECKLVKGHIRSAIYDLPRATYKLIPNDLFFILSTFKRHTIDDIKNNYVESQHQIIDEYFNMLIDNEFIFFCDEDELELFVDINTEWDYPGFISNAIIELPMQNDTLTSSLLSLEKLGCRFIQFRSFNTLDLNYIEAILMFLHNKDFDYVEIISKCGNHDIARINNILQNNQRLRLFYFYGAEKSVVLKDMKYERQKIVFSTEMKEKHSDFHVNNKFYFKVNITLYCESVLFNNYYNRKVCITKEGEIKNCLSLERSFGNVNNFDSIYKIISTDEFQLLWHINHDKIKICQDCEFRYMCVDNTPLRYENGEWIKTSHCFYNPYKPDNF